MPAIAQHHKYSASSSEGWLNCPGKMSMEEGIPDKHSLYADEGSAAHFLAAHCLDSGMPVAMYLGETVICWEKPDGSEGQCFASKGLPNGASLRSEWDVTEDMAEFVCEYTTLVNDAGTDSYVFVEQKVDFGGFIGIPGAFGTSDSVIVSRDSRSITIIDLKYGFTHVDAELNTQMMLYAAGAIEELDVICDFQNLETIRLIIAQPRVSRFPEWTIDMRVPFEGFPNIMSWFSDVCRKAIARSEEAHSGIDKTIDDWADEYLIPSPKGCTWCRAKSHCPALVKQNLQAIADTAEATVDGLDDLDAVGEGNTDAAMVERAALLIPALPFDKLARAYELIPQIETWIKAVNTRMLNDMMKGAKHPDWKLVHGRAGHLSWKSDAAVNEILENCGLDEDSLMEKKLMTPTTAKKVFKSNKKVLAQIDLSTMRKPKSTVVAPATDSRPPINPYEEIDALPEYDALTMDDIITRFDEEII